MGLTSRIILGVVLCLLSLVPPLGLATEHATPLQSSAHLGAVEGTSITYGLKDYNRQVVKAVVAAQSSTEAEEMTCSKDDGTHCILAKDANGDEVEVQVSAVKAGEKLTCTEKRDHIHCQKDPRELQHDAMLQQ